MAKSDAAQALDFGRLLRMRAMVTAAAQQEAAVQSAGALVRAYMFLRSEMLGVLGPASGELREEFERLFPVIEEPPKFETRMGVTQASALTRAAHEAHISLSTLQAWIQGLIDELTFSERLRLEAEAKAAQANRPMGFQG